MVHWCNKCEYNGPVITIKFYYYYGEITFEW